MANTVIGASVQIEFGSVGELRKTLQEATNRAKELKKQFGETSEEFKNAQDDVNKLKTSLDNLNLKSKLKEANLELVAMQDRFGATSKEAIAAAQKVAGLKDQIEDARETADLFDPGKKFQAFVTLGSQIAAGFSAVQGAMALVGAESEDVQKALLKVQGAMALAQGLSQLKDFGKSWQQMKIFINSATQGLSGFKRALISTGIGALVVAIGTLVAYWDDIKGLVNGVSVEQEKLNAQTKQNVDAEQEKMDILNSSDEILKQQGKSEKEILQIKIEQLKSVIAATEAQIEQAKITKDSQIAAAKRNNEITKMVVRGWLEGITGILRAMAAPIDLLIVTANGVSEALGMGKIVATTINEEITKMNVAATDWVANQLFDPKQVEEDGNKTIKEMKGNLLKQKNQLAGYENQITGINKKGNETRAAQDKQAGNDRLEAEKILAEARRKMMTEEAGELFDLEQKRIEDINKLAKAGYVEGTKERALIDESYENQRIEIISKYQKERKEKEKEFLNEINKINENIRIAGIKDLREKEKAELQITHREQLTQMAANENLTFLQRLTLTVALKKKQKQEEDALQQKFDQEDTEREKIAHENTLKMVKEQNAALIDAEINLQNKRYEAATAGLSLLESLAGENEKIANAIFAVQKGLEIARIVTDTARGIVAAKAGLAAVPPFIGAIPNPAFILAAASAAKQIAGLKIAAAVSIAQIAAASINKFKKGSGSTPGGGGPAPAPPPGTLAPVTPALSPAVQGQMLNSDAINNLGNTALRAYVMNSDIQNNDQRNAYLQRNARIG